MSMCSRVICSRRLFWSLSAELVPEHDTYIFNFDLVQSCKTSEEYEMARAWTIQPYNEPFLSSRLWHYIAPRSSEHSSFSIICCRNTNRFPVTISKVCLSANDLRASLKRRLTLRVCASSFAVVLATAIQ